MNKFILILALSFVTLTAQARDVIIAVSPYQSTFDAKAQRNSIIRFFTTMDAGDRLIILNAVQLKTIGKFTVPINKKYQSPKARMTKNRMAIARVSRFYNEILVPESSLKNIIRLPQLLHHIAGNYVQETPLDVILLGSPFYHDPKQPVLSMLDAHVPADGHLNASRAQTIYGTKDNQAALKNIRVHLGFETEELFHHDQHRYYVERFWSLFISLQGGSLVTFAADHILLFDRVKNQSKALKNTHKVGKETTLEMIKMLGAVSSNEVSIFDRPVSSQPLSVAEIQNANAVEVAASWDCACDIDIHAQAFNGATILSFLKKSTPEGLHLKDYTHSPHGDNAFETIRFLVPIDFNKLKLALHFFSDNPPKKVNVELRIAVGDKVFAQHLIMHPRGQTQKVFDNIFTETNNSYVAVVDPLTVIKH